MKFQVPRGTRDILPGEVERWQWLEERTRAVQALYGYREVRTPFFEATDLFVRSVGEATDIVRKELYTFEDRKGRSLTLRPEGTAPLVRAYLENPALRAETPARLYYMGPMFRYERPQAGRYRQFWQIGSELLGSAKPEADAEMIDLFRAILADVGLGDVTVLLNSLGDMVCRPRYREAIRAYFSSTKTASAGLHGAPRDEPARILIARFPVRSRDRGRPQRARLLCPECASTRAVKRASRRWHPLRGGAAAGAWTGLIHAHGLRDPRREPGRPECGGRRRALRPAGEGSAGRTRPRWFSIGWNGCPGRRRGAGPKRVADAVCVIALGRRCDGGAGAAARSGPPEEPSGRRALVALVDAAGRSANAQMKWASKVQARWAVFVPKGPEGYAVRDMAKGADEERQPSIEALRNWLSERRPSVEASR